MWSIAVGTKFVLHVRFAKEVVVIAYSESIAAQHGAVVAFTRMDLGIESASQTVFGREPVDLRCPRGMVNNSIETFVFFDDDEDMIVARRWWPSRRVCNANGLGARPGRRCGRYDSNPEGGCRSVYRHVAGRQGLTRSSPAGRESSRDRKIRSVSGTACSSYT